MKKTYVLSAVMALLTSSAALAQNAIVDYQGYAWETGGLPPSNSGDVLSIVGVVDAIDSRFGILATEEVTFYVTGLTSGGQVDQGGGILSVSYSGGTIDFYRDALGAHDYGVSPPNGTAPSTFVNGSLLLGGTFDNFFLFFDTNTGSGAYEGEVFFTSGSGLADLNQTDADGYTFGGVLNSSAAGGNVPEGYNLQVDGVLEVIVPVGVQQKSWSEIKGLYRN